jgi:hypothetical protein
MKKVILSLVLVSILISCKNKKEEVENTNQESEVSQPMMEEAITTPKLPANVVQLNDIAYKTDNITLTKLQIENVENNKFVLKAFLDSDNMDLYKNEDYSLFIQNFAYESDVINLEEKFQKTGAASYWVNLKALKNYKEEYVLFKSFESEITNFKKTVIGVMNLKTKTDIFRVQYDDTYIVN